MNRTTVTVDLLSREHVRLTALLKESTDFAREVRNNLGVYFVFCLFALAILALFLCCSMQALQTNAFFSLFYVAKFGRFLCINNFYRRGTLDFK